MTIQEQLLEVLQGYDDLNFDPVDCQARFEEILQNACLRDGEIDPRDQVGAENACNAYGYASQQFLHNNLPSAATSILVEGWELLSSIQEDENRRIYRAGIAMYLAKAYLALGDRGASLRWGLLTQSDDLLGAHPAGGGAGRQLLVSALGMTQSGLELLSEIARENLEVVEQQGWIVPDAYPEDLVTKFALRGQEHAHIFGASTEVSSHPLNQPYFRSLSSKVEMEGLSAAEKGAYLEDLATYVFMLLPGLVPRRNVLEETRAFETDIVIRNISPIGNVVTDLLGRHFLVECKNWENAVGVQDIGYFLYRIRLTHASFGIIFSSQGITGDEDQEDAAYSLVRKAFHEDGTICIVIDHTDLSRMAESMLSPWAIILERMERIRFGKPR